MTLHPLQNQTSAFIFYNEFVITSYIGYIVTVKKNAIVKVDKDRICMIELLKSKFYLIIS